MKVLLPLTTLYNHIIWTKRRYKKNVYSKYHKIIYFRPAFWEIQLPVPSMEGPSQFLRKSP